MPRGSTMNGNLLENQDSNQTTHLFRGSVSQWGPPCNAYVGVEYLIFSNYSDHVLPKPAYQINWTVGPWPALTHSVRHC